MPLCITIILKVCVTKKKKHNQNLQGGDERFRKCGQICPGIESENLVYLCKSELQVFGRSPLPGLVVGVAQSS